MGKQWSPKATWLALAGAAAVTVGGAAWGVSALVHKISGGSSSGVSGDSRAAASVLTGRIWVDHIPKKETEYFEIFVALGQQPTGVFEKGSAFEGQFEIFTYETAGDGKLKMVFPQTKKKFDVKYEAKECREASFDYCLTMSGAPRGAKSYGSRRGWEIESTNVADVERAVESLKAKIEAGASPDDE